MAFRASVPFDETTVYFNGKVIGPSEGSLQIVLE